MKPQLTVWIWILGVTALAGLAAVGWFGTQYANAFFLDRASQRAESTLRLTVAALKGGLSRYRPLPDLIADRRDVRSLLNQPEDARLAGYVSGELRRINKVVSASDIYVMRRNGLTIAASNAGSKGSFVGKNFNYRPYFRDAAAGGRGAYFALGTTSLKRGYYFSAPVRRDETIVGVIAVKMDVDEIEAAWRGAEHELLVVDEHGIVFMAGRPEWRFGAIQPLTPKTLARLEDTKRYPREKLHDLAFNQVTDAGTGRRFATVTFEGRATRYLMKSTRMEDAGWTVHVLTDTAPVRTQTLTALAVGVLLILTILLTGAFVIQRRQSLIERLQAQRAARDELERRVDERTADLNSANAQLVEEIAERKSAEDDLRQAQSDLIQAGKLAALGQMSAALSHEFNQPLGAVKTYADNAATYIDRGRSEEARDNISRISSLVDRMAAIGKNLRNFARKPDQELSPIPVGPTVADALEIVSTRIAQQRVAVTTNLGAEPLFVLGGRNRLQQVLVNLLSNALDANEAGGDMRIDIEAVPAGADRVVLTVRDYGSGIDPAISENIFDPFFTTKGVGKGLGLGLSITYNIVRDFGGTLTVENHPEGGAVFRLDLERAYAELGVAAK